LFFWQVGWGCPRNSLSDDFVESTFVLFFWQVGWRCAKNSSSDDYVELTFFCFFDKMGGDAPEIVFLLILWNQLGFLFFWQVGWGCPTFMGNRQKIFSFTFKWSWAVLDF